MSMSAQVFISYPSGDHDVATRICGAIERRRVSCWIAHRDVGPGENFQEAIVRAIRAARVMVFVFSRKANGSSELQKELALASQNRLAVIPVRVEDVAPNDALLYEFSIRQWIDLFDNWDRSLDRLTATIGAILASPAPERPSAADAPAPPRPAPPAPRRRAGLFAAGGLAAALMLGLGILASLRPGPEPPAASVATVSARPDPGRPSVARAPTAPEAVPPIATAPPAPERAPAAAAQTPAAPERIPAVAAVTPAPELAPPATTRAPAALEPVPAVAAARPAPEPAPPADKVPATPGPAPAAPVSAAAEPVPQLAPASAAAAPKETERNPAPEAVRDTIASAATEAATTPAAPAEKHALAPLAPAPSASMPATAPAAAPSAQAPALAPVPEPPPAAVVVAAVPPVAVALPRSPVQGEGIHPPKERESVAVGPAPSVRAAGEGGQVFRECGVCPEMIVVPAGTAVIGSPPGERGRDAAKELPQRQIRIAAPFAVSRFQVTFAEWDACVAEGGCNNWTQGDAGWGRGRRPAIFVSWNDARAYVAWLSGKTGGAYRLLSEAEWEYAARGCRAPCPSTPFWFGETVLPEYANYNSMFAYAGGSKATPKRRTVPVDEGPANAFGLVHMVGNVRQWVEDCWSLPAGPGPGDARPATGGDCTRRVVRGGSWNDEPGELRSAARSWEAADVRTNRIGFRIARTLER